jgi:hypothetical protein
MIEKEQYSIRSVLPSIFNTMVSYNRRQVDNAVSWLEKRYFTEEVRAKKELNESAGHLAKANRNDKVTSP